jgi:hypothetical protein
LGPSHHSRGYGPVPVPGTGPNRNGAGTARTVPVTRAVPLGLVPNGP